MAATSGTQMTKVDAGTPPDPGFVNGTVRCFAETVTLASQASADTIEVGWLPKGAVPLYGVLTTTTSLGSSTISIGTSGSTAKYRADATFTATDTPTTFGKSAAVNTALTADETVIITVATAALPSSGTLHVTLFYAFN